MGKYHASFPKWVGIKHLVQLSNVFYNNKIIILRNISGNIW